MKPFFYQLLGDLDDALSFIWKNLPIRASVITLIYAAVATILFRRLKMYLPEEIVRDALFIGVLVLFAYVGYCIVKAKELPVFIKPVKGNAAVIVGILMMVGSLAIILLRILPYIKNLFG